MNNNNVGSVNSTTVKEWVDDAFGKCNRLRAEQNDMPDYVRDCRCVRLERSRIELVYEVVLGCGRKFTLFIGQTKRALHKFRKMVNGMQRYIVQGFAMDRIRTAEQVLAHVIDCVRAAAHALVQHPAPSYERADEVPDWDSLSRSKKADDDDDCVKTRAMASLSPVMFSRGLLTCSFRTS